MREYKTRDGAVMEFREGREFREVDAMHQGYLEWMGNGNSPEVLPPRPAPNPLPARDLAIAELVSLDLLGVTRAAEDLYTAMPPEQQSAVPRVTRDRIARKSVLRASL